MKEKGLIHLIEECSESIKISTKILRFGQHSHHPNDETKTPNRNLLIQELGDLQVAIDLVANTFNISEEELKTARNGKREKITKWLL